MQLTRKRDRLAYMARPDFHYNHQVYTSVIITDSYEVLTSVISTGMHMPCEESSTLRVHRCEQYIMPSSDFE